MKYLYLNLCLLLLLGSTCAFRVLTAEVGSTSASLWNVGSHSGTPAYAYYADPIGSVPLQPSFEKNEQRVAMSLTNPSVVMLGEPDQFDRTFIATPAGLFFYNGTDKAIHPIGIPFDMARPLAGCRNQRNIDYYLLFNDNTGKTLLWKFQPPTYGPQEFLFEQVNVSLPLKSGVDVPDKCVFQDNIIQFYAHYSSNSDLLYTVDMYQNTVTTETMMSASVLAMGNSPSVTRAYGLVASQGNEPVTFASSISSKTIVNKNQTVINVRGTSSATGPVATRTPSFCPTYASQEIWYAAGPQGPVVSASSKTMNGEQFLLLNVPALLTSWPTDSYVLALSN